MSPLPILLAGRLLAAYLHERHIMPFRKSPITVVVIRCGDAAPPADFNARAQQHAGFAYAQLLNAHPRAQRRCVGTMDNASRHAACDAAHANFAMSRYCQCIDSLANFGINVHGKRHYLEGSML